MIEEKIKNIKELKKEIAAARKKGKKIVFTNGCFDILHLGHIKYLEQASLLGNKLVVAVNSDASVRKIKGKTRPVMAAGERAVLVAALGCVDYVIIFREATPFNLIKALKPDILVKGGNWRHNDIAGKDIMESRGGKVVYADFVKGCSSSAIIAKIKKKKQENCL